MKIIVNKIVLLLIVCGALEAHVYIKPEVQNQVKHLIIEHMDRVSGLVNKHLAEATPSQRSSAQKRLALYGSSVKKAAAASNAPTGNSSANANQPTLTQTQQDIQNIVHAIPGAYFLEQDPLLKKIYNDPTFKSSEAELKSNMEQIEGNIFGAHSSSSSQAPGGVFGFLNDICFAGSLGSAQSQGSAFAANSSAMICSVVIFACYEDVYNWGASRAAQIGDLYKAARSEGSFKENYEKFQNERAAQKLGDNESSLSNADDKISFGRAKVANNNLEDALKNQKIAQKEFDDVDKKYSDFIKNGGDARTSLLSNKYTQAKNKLDVANKNLENAQSKAKSAVDELNTRVGREGGYGRNLEDAFNNKIKESYEKNMQETNFLKETTGNGRALTQQAQSQSVKNAVQKSDQAGKQAGRNVEKSGEAREGGDDELGDDDVTVGP